MFVNGPSFGKSINNGFSFFYDINFVNYKVPTASNRRGVSVFQGHHGESMLSDLYDFLLPSKTFLETNSLFVNFYGSFSRTNKALVTSLFLNSRSNWKISMMLAKVLGIGLLNYKVFNEFPTQPIGVWSKKTCIPLYRRTVLKSHNAFSPYMGDPISRSSRILSMCQLFSRELNSIQC